MLVGAALLLGGCATESVPAFDDVGAAGSWRMETLEVAGASLDADLVMNLDLTNAILEGETACHTILGSFTIAVDDEGAEPGETTGLSTFTIPGTGTTACDAALLEAEEQTIDALESVTRWRTTADQLLLSGPEVELVFRRVG